MAIFNNAELPFQKKTISLGIQPLVDAGKNIIFQNQRLIPGRRHFGESDFSRRLEEKGSPIERAVCLSLYILYVHMYNIFLYMYFISIQVDLMYIYIFIHMMNVFLDLNIGDHIYLIYIYTYIYIYLSR